jgi:hypothetical protein
MIKLAAETIKSKKKVGFISWFIPIFMYSRIWDPRSGAFHPPDPG